MTGLELDGRLRLGTAKFSFQLAVNAGEHVAVVGPNGAGKSTLVRTIAGLERLTGGTLAHSGVMLDAPDAGHFVPPHRRPIALQPQDGALFPHLNVLDNVAFPLRAAGASRAAARAGAHQELERVDATRLAAQRPESLSGGEAARVALARSLAAAPDVLLLDEPAAALDVTARAALRRLISSLDQTVLTVSHDPLEARLLGHSLAVVSDGEVAQVGSADQVAASPATPWVANFAGVNIVSGQADGLVVTSQTAPALHTAEEAHGPVHVAFPAAAVTLGSSRPTGSARNVFEATVTGLAVEGDRVRVSFDAGFHAAALVTAASASELQLRPGGPVWASVKATELTVLPA